MGQLRDDEVRRLLSYLRRQMDDADRLAEVEDVLRSDEAEEYLREPELLAYFPELLETVDAGGDQWRLRVIPHAHLRMVQRGFTLPLLLNLFARFVSYCEASKQLITRGSYVITGRPARRMAAITLRADVDSVAEADKRAHVVTIYVGRGMRKV